MIGRVSATDASVLITGESGTGKELVADAIHRNSRRRQAPFVKVNLGGISSSLFESEMFGHVRGAFTDARHDRKGRFETASGGTIFLDEIGDLDPASQVKLLRVLQDRTFEVLGSSQRRTVDVRVVAATNRNLGDMVARGEFREDLLYRINLITLHLPPLRERRDDIPILASRFLQAVGQVYRREDVRLSADALAWLKNQPWPGNVRQLKQGIERTVLVTDKPVLEAADFQATVRDGAARGRARRAAAGWQHDDGRAGKGDDRQVAQAPQRQHLQGRAGAGPEPRRACTGGSRSTRSPCEPARAVCRLPGRRPPADGGRRLVRGRAEPLLPHRRRGRARAVVSDRAGPHAALLRDRSSSSARARSCSKTATSCRASARSSRPTSIG